MQETCLEGGNDMETSFLDNASTRDPCVAPSG